MDIAQLNLIHFLDFYFTTMFVLGTLRRLGQYRAIARLIWLMPGRWPNLLELVKKHRAIFMTWATVAPALLAGGVMLLQLIASRAVWPDAGRPPNGLTLTRLGHNVPALLIVAPIGLTMLALDVFTLIYIGHLDRAALEKNFDQAEYWLKSKTAHVVRVFTFGFVNPRRMVHDEVGKSLVGASNLLNRSLWWMFMQTGLRFAFGLGLWLTWAFGAF
ncbi:MAG: hypothetical protein U0793_17000 [Gemmataceae bacterium]